MFFSGVGTIGSLVEGDEHSKMTKEKAIEIFNFNVKLGGNFGVRAIHFEEEMMLFLSEMRSLLSY